MRWLIPAFLLIALAGCASSSFVEQSTEINGPARMHSSCPAGNASLARALPDGLPALPMMPDCVIGPGDVRYNTTMLAAFNEANPKVARGTAIDVDSINGNDSACKPTALGAAPSTPCKTLYKALKNTTAQTINLLQPLTVSTGRDGTAFPLDFRVTDAGGNTPKLIQCAVALGKCAIQIYGDNIASDTWTLASGSGLSAVYETTIDSAEAGTSGDVVNVLYSARSGKVDAWGFPTRLVNALPVTWNPNYSYSIGQYAAVGNLPAPTCYRATAANKNITPPNAKYWSTGDCDTAGLANLALIPSGWYDSPSTHVLYVKDNGADLTNSAVAADYQAYFYPPGNAEPRALFSGVTAMLLNVTLNGMDILCQEAEASGNYYPSTCWGQGVTDFAGPGNGIDNHGSTVFFSDSVIHAKREDGTHSDLGVDGLTSTPETPLVMLVDSHVELAGDPETYYANGILPSLELINHCMTSHIGFEVAFGDTCTSDWGPELTSTDISTSEPGWTASVPSITWMVGTVAANYEPTNNINPGGFAPMNTSRWPFSDPRNLVGYYDTVWGYNENGRPLYSDGNTNSPNCNIFNITLDQPIFYTPATGYTPCAKYNPSAP